MHFVYFIIPFFKTVLAQFHRRYQIESNNVMKLGKLNCVKNISMLSKNKCLVVESIIECSHIIK